VGTLQKWNNKFPTVKKTKRNIVNSSNSLIYLILLVEKKVLKLPIEPISLSNTNPLSRRSNNLEKRH
jgi:hypothetical protein